MSEIGFFTPEQLRRVWAQTLRMEQQSPARPDDFLPLETEPILFVNDSGHEIPPYGIMQAKNTYDQPGGANYVSVVRPFDYAANQSIVLVNGPTAVPDGEYGSAQLGPLFRVVHDGAESYGVGDRLGWVSGSFLAGLGALFRVVGVDDITDDCLRVMFDQSVASMQSFGAIAAGSSGLAYLRDPSSETWTTDTSKEYPVFNDSGSNIADNTRMIGLPTDGRFLVVEVC